MKRSEMIDLIYAHLESYAGMLYHGIENEDAAKELLDAIEEAGMLPPSNIESTTLGSFECQIENYKICEKSTYDEIPFKWEDE